MAAFSKCVVVGLTLVALGFIGGSSAWGATGRYGTRTVEQSIVQRMKGMVLPKVSFGPPATIVDAIDFFRMVSKDFDRSDIPEDRRGFEFVLHLDGPVDEAPVLSSTVSASNVSFFKALNLVCTACTPQCVFKIQDGKIVVMPRTKLSTVEKAPMQEGDAIEIALDYILGRNGQAKDAKAGIRMLCAAAQEKPAAQRVFVRRWCAGDLDDALDAVPDETWDDILAWFKDAFAHGEKKAGLLLGRRELKFAEDENRTNRGSHYVNAVRYLKAAGEAGDAQSWYRLGCLVLDCPKLPFNKPRTDAERQQNRTYRAQFKPFLALKLTDRDAKIAFKKALQLRPGYEDAKWRLAGLYLFGDKRVADSRAAHEIFTEFYKKDKTAKWHVYYYGLSGWCLMTDKMNADVYQRAIAVQLTPQSIEYDSWQKRINEYNVLFERRQSYVAFIERAAKMGCEPAQRFMSKLSQGQ